MTDKTEQRTPGSYLAYSKMYDCYRVIFYEAPFRWNLPIAPFHSFLPDWVETDDCAMFSIEDLLAAKTELDAVKAENERLRKRCEVLDNAADNALGLLLALGLKDWGITDQLRAALATKSTGDKI